MKIVTAVLQIEYVDREMPDLIQTMIWQTYDESPEFPRLVDQLNEISGQEGREIKNWFISQKDPLGPKQTHGLQSVRAN